MSRGDESVAPTILRFGDRVVTEGGITLREYFAGLAMQGLLAADITGRRHDEGTAKAAVSRADALLAELAKPNASGTEAGQAELRG